MPRWIGRALLAASVAPGMLHATSQISPQSKPDFSGRWICVSPRNLADLEMTVTQNEQTLHYVPGWSPFAMKYTLNGSETRHVFPLVTGDIIVLARAAWRGPELEIVETTDVPEEPRTHRIQRWSMKGTELAITYDARTAGQSRPQVQDSLWRRR